MVSLKSDSTTSKVTPISIRVKIEGTGDSQNCKKARGGVGLTQKRVKGVFGKFLLFELGRSADIGGNDLQIIIYPLKPMVFSGYLQPPIRSK